MVLSFTCFTWSSVVVNGGYRNEGGGGYQLVVPPNPTFRLQWPAKVPGQSLDVAFCGCCRAFADGPL